LKWGYLLSSALFCIAFLAQSLAQLALNILAAAFGSRAIKIIGPVI